VKLAEWARANRVPRKTRRWRHRGGGSWSLTVATADDLVWGMIEVLTSMCARLYGRRGARNRASRAVTAVKKPAGEPAA
jgi:hypothetical protein